MQAVVGHGMVWYGMAKAGQDRAGVACILVKLLDMRKVYSNDDMMERMPAFIVFFRSVQMDMLGL